LNNLSGGFKITKVAHNIFQGAKHLITGKSEGKLIRIKEINE